MPRPAARTCSCKAEANWLICHEVCVPESAHRCKLQPAGAGARARCGARMAHWPRSFDEADRQRPPDRWPAGKPAPSMLRAGDELLLHLQHAPGRRCDTTPAVRGGGLAGGAGVFPYAEQLTAAARNTAVYRDGAMAMCVRPGPGRPTHSLPAKLAWHRAGQPEGNATTGLGAGPRAAWICLPRCRPVRPVSEIARWRRCPCGWMRCAARQRTSARVRPQGRPQAPRRMPTAACWRVAGTGLPGRHAAEPDALCLSGALDQAAGLGATRARSAGRSCRVPCAGLHRGRGAAAFWPWRAGLLALAGGRQCRGLGISAAVARHGLRARACCFLCWA